MKNTKFISSLVAFACIALLISCGSSGNSKKYQDPVKARKKKGGCDCPRKFSYNSYSPETTYELATR